MLQTLNSPLPPAEICRRNGWGPHTKLVGDEGYGPTVIEITAVGMFAILARIDGEPLEQMWHLDSRDWKPV